MYKCNFCAYYSKEKKFIEKHTKICSKKIKKNKKFYIRQSAFNKKLVIYSSKSSSSFRNLDVSFYFFNMNKSITSLLENTIKTMFFRFQVVLHVKFEKPKIQIINGKPDVTFNIIDTYFCSSMVLVMKKTDIRPKLIQSYNRVLKLFDEFVNNGSGWSLRSINRIDIQVAKYKAMRGGCSENKLPLSISKKGAIISIKNEINENKCFLWCILLSLHQPKKGSGKITSKHEKLLKNIDYSMLKYPTSLNEIHHFENVNDFSINIFSLNKDNDVYPLQLTSNKKASKEINLLFYKKHFYLIKNINRLLGRGGVKVRHFCYTCCQGFWEKHVLKNHKIFCEKNKPLKIKMPSQDDNILKFKEFSKTLRVPFVAYYDFESLLKKVEGPLPDNCKSYQHNIQKHEPCSFAVIILDHLGEIIYKKLKRTLTPALDLMKTLQKQSNKLLRQDNFKTEKIKMTIIDKINFKSFKLLYLQKNFFS